MYLKFICPDGFELSAGICSQIQSYLPNFIQSIEIIRSDIFRGVFDRLSIVPMIEGVVEVDWKRDVVLMVIHGALYFADIELSEAVGCTLEGLPVGAGGTAKPFAKMPRLGAIFLPNNMSKAPRADAGYWAKLGMEEILHYFRVPEQHDEGCFFHAKAFGEATVADCYKDYCLKCRRFMGELKDPLDFGKLFVKMQEMYGLKPIPKWKPARTFWRR